MNILNRLFDTVGIFFTTLILSFGAVLLTLVTGCILVAFASWLSTFVGFYGSFIIYIFIVCVIVSSFVTLIYKGLIE